jgi:hypothetical protein
VAFCGEEERYRVAGVSPHLALDRNKPLGRWDSIGLVIRPFDKSFYLKSVLLSRHFFS